MFEFLKTLPVMELLGLASEVLSGLSGASKNLAQVGRTLQAGDDIYLQRFDRKNGYVETMFAMKGDNIDVLAEEYVLPSGGYRVRNNDNHDQVDTIRGIELIDEHQLYS